MELVVIIDSGLDCNSVDCKNVIGGISLINIDNEIKVIENTFDDCLGHGTAIFNIVNNSCSDVRFFIIKIFQESFECNQNMLLNAMEYIYMNLDCKFLIICSGTIVFDNYSSLKKILDDLYSRGTIIISAFSNQGALSFPASDKHVIGVDCDASVGRNQEYIVLKGSPIDLLCCEHSYKVRWKNGNLIIEKGNSYAAAECASKIINAYNTIKVSDKESLIDYIQIENNRIEFQIPDFNKLLNPLSFINCSGKRLKAITYPFSKEIRALAAYEDLLTVDIIGNYDMRQSGNVGFSISELLGYGNNDRKIRDIEKVDWNDDFDLIICGHLGAINKLTNRHWEDELLKLAIKYNKRIYTLDYYKCESKNQVCPPKINSYTGNTLGKLWAINTPVIGVFGTSAKQGKFSLQLELRRKFILNGFKVQQISTEPTGCLFGMDYTCPIGYNGSISLKGSETALFFNEIMHRCDLNDPDIIIVGSQSGTIPHNRYHSSFFTFTQYEFLIGTSPDICILLINSIDEIEYIENTIKFIESSSGCSVVACVLSPINFKNTLSEFLNINSLSKIINKPVFEFKNAFNDLYELIINYFGGAK